jgi:hypothetical protein
MAIIIDKTPQMEEMERKLDEATDWYVFEDGILDISDHYPIAFFNEDEQGKPYLSTPACDVHIGTLEIVSKLAKYCFDNDIQYRISKGAGVEEEIQSVRDRGYELIELSNLLTEIRNRQ